MSKEGLARAKILLADGRELPPALVATAKTKVYEIVVGLPSETGPHFGFASASLILHEGKYRLLTNSHVVMEDPSRAQIVASFLGDFNPLKNTKVRAMVWARDYSGELFCVRFLRAQRSFDVALLEIVEQDKIKEETVLSFSEGFEEGDSLMLCGCPGDGRWVQQARAKGHVSRVRTDTGLIINLQQADRGVLPGFSGGPVLDMNCNLVGICATSNLRTRTHFADIGSIRSLLKK